MYERAAQCDDPVEQARWTSFVIVGAGTTGVEMAGQLASLTAELRHEIPLKASGPQIVLVDALDAVLSVFPESLRHHTHERLTGMGVEIRLQARVDSVDAEGITVKSSDGSIDRVDARTVIWAGGVQPSPLAISLARAAGIDVDHKSRVVVRPNCSLPGNPEVFVIGDMANQHDLPQLSEPAIQQGRYVAKLLRYQTVGRPAPGPFTYRNLGTMATISPTDAIADIFGIKLHGWIGKLAWAGVHIAFLVGWGNRVGVLARWAFLLSSGTRPERALFSDPHRGNAALQGPPSTGNGRVRRNRSDDKT